MCIFKLAKKLLKQSSYWENGELLYIIQLHTVHRAELHCSLDEILFSPIHGQYIRFLALSEPSNGLLWPIYIDIKTEALLIRKSSFWYNT